MVAESLKIPLSTAIFEVKKLVFLQYLLPQVTTETLQDNRKKHYILSPKGILFLHLLKESISLSIQSISNGDLAKH